MNLKQFCTCCFLFLIMNNFLKNLILNYYNFMVVAPLLNVDLKERKVEKAILDVQAIKLIEMEIEMVRRNKGSTMTTYVTIVGKDRTTILVEIATPYLVGIFLKNKF